MSWPQKMWPHSSPRSYKQTCQFTIDMHNCLLHYVCHNSIKIPMTDDRLIFLTRLKWGRNTPSCLHVHYCGSPYFLLSTFVLVALQYFLDKALGQLLVTLGRGECVYIILSHFNMEQVLVPYGHAQSAVHCTPRSAGRRGISWVCLRKTQVISRKQYSLPIQLILYQDIASWVA